MTASWVGDDERAYSTGIVDPTCLVSWCGKPWSAHYDDPALDAANARLTALAHEPVGQGRLMLAWDAAIREAVFRRDGWRCLVPDCRSGSVTFDHVLPVCEGGETTVDNGQTLCSRHNGRKGSKVGPEWDFRRMS